MESVIQESLFLVGPVLVTVLVAVASPSAAVIGTALIGTVGTIAFAGSRASREWRPVEGTAPPLRSGPLGGAVLPVVYASTLLQGVVFGSLQLAVAAFSTERDQTGLIAVLMTAFALGSLASGVWYAATRHDAPLRTRYLRTLGVHAVGGLLVLASPNAIALTVALVVFGASIAPMFALSTLTVQRAADPDGITQAFAWLSTATVAGIAIGNAGTGAIIGAVGIRAALGLLAAITVLNAGIVLLRRRRFDAATGAAA